MFVFLLTCKWKDVCIYLEKTLNKRIKLINESTNLTLFVLDLHMKYSSGGGPSTYVYCVVCYLVIVAPYVGSVGHVIVYLYLHF